MEGLAAATAAAMVAAQHPGAALGDDGSYRTFRCWNSES